MDLFIVSATEEKFHGFTNLLGRKTWSIMCSWASDETSL